MASWKVQSHASNQLHFSENFCWNRWKIEFFKNIFVVAILTVFFEWNHFPLKIHFCQNDKNFWLFLSFFLNFRNPIVL